MKGTACAAILLCCFTCAAQPAGERERARELLIAGRPLEAIPIYETLIRQSPANPELRTDLSIACFTAHRYPEAILQAQAALKLNPDLTIARLFLGSSYVESGEPSKAIHPLETVVRAQPGDRNARLMLARALQLLERFDEGAAQFEKAGELAPDSPKVWFGLGECYQRLAETAAADREHYRDLAANAWERLMRLPRSRESCIYEARRSEYTGEYIEAAGRWREALNLTPGDSALEWGLTWALYKGRDYEAALRLLQDLSPDPKTEADASFLRGACLLNLQQPAESVPYLKKALRMKPGFLPARLALGQALLRTRRAREAIPHLRAALSLDEDGSVHFELFRACQMAGDADAASRALAAYRSFTAERTPTLERK